MATIQIGQDAASIATAEKVLQKDGAKLLVNYLAIQIPWTTFPIVSYFVNIIVDNLSNFFVTKIDNAGYAAYVAIQTGKQVSDYLVAKSSNDQSKVDQSGDNLIKLGNK